MGVQDRLKAFAGRLLHGKPSEATRLIARAGAFRRYTPQVLTYRHYRLQVPDFLSVAWQIMELFEEERLRFRTTSEAPLVIDVGSKVGVSVLYLRSIHPRCTVICFEADPAILALDPGVMDMQLDIHVIRQ